MIYGLPVPIEKQVPSQDVAAAKPVVEIDSSVRSVEKDVGFKVRSCSPFKKKEEKKKKKKIKTN